jgi:protein involved in polysaccharide export with SLBB domain
MSARKPRRLLGQESALSLGVIQFRCLPNGYIPVRLTAFDKIAGRTSTAAASQVPGPARHDNLALPGKFGFGAPADPEDRPLPWRLQSTGSGTFILSCFAQGGHTLARLLKLSSYLIIPVLLVCCGCQTAEPPYAPMPGPVTTASSPQPEPVNLTNRIDPASLQPPNELFTLGPGDKIEIDYGAGTNAATTTVVGPDGKIYFDLLPGLDVWGLTLSQAKARIEEGLANYVREPPQVSVVLRGVESRTVWVLGYVHAPGVYPMAAPMTVLEAVALAGGPMSLSSIRMEAVGTGDDVADLQRSFVLRLGRMLPVDFQSLLQQGDLAQNIYLEPGDFIYFPAATAKEVYVMGAVQQPQAVPYRQGLTVAGAVASAYGTITGAYLTHVAVVRGSLTRPQLMIVDYKHVIRGEAMDIALQPNDIVYVPFSPYRYLERYARLIIDTFVSSAAINAGTQWIGVPGGGAGVFIPVSGGTPGTPVVNPPPVK